MAAPKVHLFVGNSNIFISAQDEAQKLEGRAARLQLRLYFENLFKLALVGRVLGTRALSGPFHLNSAPYGSAWRQRPEFVQNFTNEAL